ncbi:MAG: hypothetical protein WCF26_10665 [Candidatus Sulfotelmatobacter sp.]
MQSAFQNGFLGRMQTGLAISALLLFLVPYVFSAPADSASEVILNAAHVGPRKVEPLTARSVLRDYQFGWANLAQAFESNSTGALNGLFAGTANTWLNDAVNNQIRTGLTSRYLNQHHKLDAVFYAPEGDLIELHDTAEYDYQILDGSNTIHTEHALVHYVVLMTPGVDRWVIRQLQSVPQF